VATVRQPDVNRLLGAAQTEVQKNRQRIEKGLDILLAREEPPVGVTPKDVIYSRGTLVLTTLPSTAARLTYMIVFGLGSTLGMAALSGLLGWPLAQAACRSFAA